MSYFTPADAQYLKHCLREVVRLSETASIPETFERLTARTERDAIVARFEAFVDGCTLTSKGK